MPVAIGVSQSGWKRLWLVARGVFETLLRELQWSRCAEAAGKGLNSNETNQALSNARQDDVHSAPSREPVQGGGREINLPKL